MSFQPPVVEVALAVQFEPGTVRSLDAAMFRARIQDKFPTYEEQPPRPPMEEAFETQIGGMPFRLEMIQGLPTPRYWFLSESGSRLVQLQADLLAENWRYLSDGDEYQRYESLRDDLEAHATILGEILEEEGRPPMRPNWCEVTYINHVPAEAPDDSLPPLEDVLTIVSRPRGDRLPPPEDTYLRQRFLIDGTEKPPRGRLTLEVAPAFRNVDRVPIWAITFTSRVRSVNGGVKNVIEALDLGREWANRGFAEVTSPEMQSQWGLKQGGGGDGEPGR